MNEDTVIRPRSDVAAGTAADPTVITDFDTYLFGQGSHCRLYEKFGAHPVTTPDGVHGVRFAVWAPNARKVSVVGDFNKWNIEANPLGETD